MLTRKRGRQEEWEGRNGSLQGTIVPPRAVTCSVTKGNTEKGAGVRAHAPSRMVADRENHVCEPLEVTRGGPP